MVSELHWYSRKLRGGAHQAQLARPDAHAQLLRADLEELPQPLPEDPGQPFLQHCPGAAHKDDALGPESPKSPGLYSASCRRVLSIITRMT